MQRYGFIPERQIFGSVFSTKYKQCRRAIPQKSLTCIPDGIKRISMKKKFWILAALLMAAPALLSFSIGASGENDEQPNAVMENILSRKSVRNYTEQPVEREKVEALLRAGMAAPSARDKRPWEFVVVTDRATLDRMANGLPYAKMLKKAPLAIVVCGDSEKSNLWEHDCSAATQNILLAAESMGLGAVWTAAFPYDDRVKVVSESLSLPENIKPLCVIPVGYPKGDHSPKEKWNPAKIHYNIWGGK